MAESKIAGDTLSADELTSLNADFETAPASTVIRWAVDTFGTDLVLAASFEDVVLIDLATKLAPDIEVIFLDTEAHFPETLAFVDTVRERYGLNLTVTKPVEGAEQWPCGTAQCCEFRKVRPLKEALVGKEAWMTGLKRVDAWTRREAPIVSYDEKPGIQAISNTATDLPPEPGVHASFARDHESERPG